MNVRLLKAGVCAPPLDALVLQLRDGSAKGTWR